jgi:3-phosphoshikimate 1-carboxyvinyltransferase
LGGLCKNSFQGDAAIADLFTKLGVKTSYRQGGIILSLNRNSAKKFNYNFVDEPDMAQTFVVTCCLLNIPFRFSGLQSLKIKETDRIIALINEMQKLGYVLEETADSVLEWQGKHCPIADEIVIDTYEDHRMAMAFAPAAFKHKIAINNPQVVSKSYPSFWDDLQKIGFELKEK